MAEGGRLARLLHAVAIGGRKGSAYDRAVLVVVGVGLALSWDGLTEREAEVVLDGLAMVLATFVGGNAAEHWAGGRKAQDGAKGAE